MACIAVRQMEHAIPTPARPSPSRGLVDGYANSFGLRKKLKRIQRAKYRSLDQAKIFDHWDDFSSGKNTAERLFKQCARLNGLSRVFAQRSN